MPTTADRRRDVLEQVARGELTPADAAELLAVLDSGASGPPAAEAAPQPTAGPRPSPDDEVDAAQEQAGPSDAGTTRAESPAEPGPVAAVHVRSSCRAVTVIGDPDIATAVADGDHTARVDGDVITIEANLDQVPGFSFIRPGLRGGRLRGGARVRFSSDSIRPLVVRMNPDLALASQVEAGSTSIRGVHGPIRAVAAAGALRVEDFDAPIDLKVAAGSATVRGRLAHGRSRIECDAGKVKVRLTPDSSVTIRGQVTLGQLSAPDSVGAGVGTLDVIASLGSVDIAVLGHDDEDVDAEDEDFEA